MSATLKEVRVSSLICCLAPFGDIPVELRMPDGQLVQIEGFKVDKDEYEGETLVCQLQPVVFGS